MDEKEKTNLTDSQENKDEKHINNDVENNEDVDSEELDMMDNEDDSNEDDDPNEDESDEGKQNVPLKTYLQEKKRRRELSRELEELKASKYESDTREYKKSVYDRITKANYDDGLAEIIADELAGLANSVKVNKDDKFILDLEEEIEDLAAEDDFFSDISDYKDQIIKKALSYKKAGIKDFDISAIYFGVRGRKRIKEFNTKNEVKNRIRNKDDVKPSSESVKNAGSKPIKSKHKLTGEDQKILKELQIAQPDAGWTPEKYLKNKK